MNDNDRARNNCPTHNGTAQLIREALRQANGEPMSVYKLFLATGKSTKQIKHAVGQMVMHGGVVSLPGPKGIVYSLWKPVARVPRRDSSIAGGEFSVAGPITYPNYRYGSTRLG